MSNFGGSAGRKRQVSDLGNLLTEANERLWLVSNTLGVLEAYAPVELQKEIKRHLEQNRELEIRIRKAFEEQL